MIKIFSIKEIINASENILSIQKKEKKSNLYLKDSHQRLKDKIISNNKEPLILKSEIKKIEKIEKLNFADVQNPRIQNNQIINELFILFNKKVKKSTIKIIVEQQKEIKELKSNISELRKKDYRSLKINKELKVKIADLINNEKILNFKILQIQKNLDQSFDKEKMLQNINDRLKIELLEIKQSQNSIKEINIKIKDSNLILQKKIDDLILHQSKSADINKINENNILILANTKNYLLNENKNFKKEIKLLNENKEILINNNTKLQSETSLLLKNKKLLIEINDEYQKKLEVLQGNHNNYEKKNLFLEKEIDKLQNDKTKIYQINQNLEEKKLNYEKKIDLISGEKIEILKENFNAKEKNKELNKQVLLLNKMNQNIAENNIKLKKEISKFIINENLMLKEKKEIVEDNNSIKNQNDYLSINDNEKSLKKINENLEIELSFIKANELKLIENNTKLQDEISRIKSNEYKFIDENELNNLKQKLHFHQDENLRLSHQLSESQKRYTLIKEQLDEIEGEKSNISQKIEDLTKTLSKNKIVNNIFQVDRTPNNKSKAEKKEYLNLENEIKKIFTKE